jgi:hypothetical protein
MWRRRRALDTAVRIEKDAEVRTLTTVTVPGAARNPKVITPISVVTG